MPVTRRRFLGAGLAAGAGLVQRPYFGPGFGPVFTGEHVHPPHNLNTKTLAMYSANNITRAQVTATISAATYDSGTGLITLTVSSTSHFTSNANLGQQCVVEGVTPPQYNGTFDVTVTVPGSQVTYNADPSNPPGGPGTSFGDIYSTNNIADLETMVGEPIMGLIVFLNGGNAPDWAHWELPNAINPANSTGLAIQTWQQAQPYRNVIVAMATMPESVTGTGGPFGGTLAAWQALALGSSGWLAQGAANASFNDGTTAPATLQGHAANFAANMMAAGYGHAIVRISGEMNGSGNLDSFGPTSSPNFLTQVVPDWTACFINIVKGMRKAVGQTFLFDWNPNQIFQNISPGGQAGFAAYYPGDAFVDIIGLDAYDNGMPGNPLTQPARWTAQTTGAIGDGGLNDVIAFASAHGKANSFPEWGLDFDSPPQQYNPPTSDDPTYVNGMLGLVKNNDFAYQAWFNNPNTGAVQLSTDVPLSLAAYKTFCGPGGNITSKPW